MSIEDEIVDRHARQMLFPLVPKASGATIRRAMFIEEWLWKDLTSPEGDPEWDARIGRLRADLESFVIEESIAPKYLFLLYPERDCIWEVRSTANEPSVRVLGLFPIKDVFVSTNFARREVLGGWQSREWGTVKRMALALWRKLFPTYQPIRTTKVNEVCSGATNGIFYKERAKISA